MQMAGLKSPIPRTTIQWIVNLAAQFFRDYRVAACQDQAAALTYMTLFALVPLMTVTYAVFSMVPEFVGVAIRVQKFLFSHFVPESGAVIQTYFSNFSKQAQKLTWLGALFLAVTSFLMLGNIERTFNRIWGVKKGRRGINKVLVYWAVLSIGPLFIGSTFALSTYLVSLKYWSLGSSVIPPALIAIYPVGITTIVFTLLFIAVPNCNVPIKYGLVGGVLAAGAFELLKALFALLVASANFKVIYGAFAALPLFLIWINLLWMIVLGGAVLVRILAQKRYLIGPDTYNDFSAAIICLTILRRAQQEGKPLDELSFMFAGVDQQHWRILRDKWLDASWIIETTTGQYALCRDLACCTLWDLADVINLRFADINQVINQLPGAATIADNIQPIIFDLNERWQVPVLKLLPINDPAPE